MCPPLSDGRKPSSVRRFVCCEAKGEDSFPPLPSVFPGRQPSRTAPPSAAPPPAKQRPPFLFSAGRTHNAARLLFPFTPRRTDDNFAQSIRPLSQVGYRPAVRSASVALPSPSSRIDSGFAQQNARAALCGKSDVKQPRKARLSPPGRTDDGFANAKCRSGAAANRLSNSRARRACHPQAGQTTVLRTQNARAVPWQVGCQTAAQGAPVTPRPDRRRFCAAKCQGYALASWMSDSRAKRACQACSSKRISS